MADVNNPQGLVWNKDTLSFEWPGIPASPGLNIPPPPPATQSFPGPGLYSINGKMWPIQDAEQWAAYAQYNPTFVAGPGLYSMNAQGAYAPLSAPAGIPPSTTAPPPPAPPPAAPEVPPGTPPPSASPGISGQSTPPLGGLPAGLPAAPAPGSGPITGPVTGPGPTPPSVTAPPGIPGSTNVNVQTTIPWPDLTQIEAQGRIQREITDANNAAAEARLRMQIAQQTGDLEARDRWAVAADELDKKRLALEQDRYNLSKTAQEAQVTQFGQTYGLQKDAQTLAREYQMGQLGVNQLAQKAQESQFGQNLTLQQLIQANANAYQMGQLGVSQQAQALAREYQMGQLGVSQQQQRAQESQFGQTYGLQQQAQDLANRYQMGQLGVSQAAQQAQVSQAAQQYGLQGRAQTLAEQQAASASDLGWSQYISSLLTNPQYASNLQGMRANSPQLVSAIEGRGIPFQQLLENRILMPQAPGR